MPTQTFTDGNDTLVLTTTAVVDTLEFLGGDDNFTFDDPNVYDEVTAHLGDGNDRATLKQGRAYVFGGSGNDRFDLYAEGSHVYGGADSDTFIIRADHYMELLGEAGNDRFNFYADSTQGVTIEGGEGDDDFVGYGHLIFGDLYGGDGNDFFLGFSQGVVNLRGGAGNDVYRDDPSWTQPIFENVGEGTDSVQVARGASYTLPNNVENISVQGFSGSTTGEANLNGNDLNNRITGHANVESIYGYGGNDVVNCKGGDDFAIGGDGNDTLDGGTGNDTLQGNEGNDVLQGRSGDDWMWGGAGDDLYYVDSVGDSITEGAGEGMDTVRTLIDNYTLTNNVENGIINYAGTSSLTGNELDNQLTGNGYANGLSGMDGNDKLNGGVGADVLNGGNGNDTLIGGSGQDILNGDAGDDLLLGGADADSMWGGAGVDTFRFNSVSESSNINGIDQIIDFQHGVDLIDLSGIDADTATDGIQDFTFAGFGKPAQASAGSLWYVNGQQANTYEVYGDVNGDGFVDLHITVTSDAALTASDFIF